MEEQEANASSAQRSDSEVDYNITPPASPRSTPLSFSEPTLRFPRPSGNHQLANWVSSSQPDIMSPSTQPLEESSLTESTYEFINTDDESQDGLATESLRSSDYGRAEDVQSVAGTERSGSGFDTESESEEEADAAPSAPARHQSSSISYAEKSLKSPSGRAVPGYSETDENTPHASPLAQSIEFQEAKGPMHLKQVSVKHTIRDFHGEEATTLGKSLNLNEMPQRLIATIRQTMAQQCLSTTKPLRIMYVGSMAARHDIIYKISSALTASATADRSGNAFDDVYNVVPVSALGSTKVPEVELMRTSRYQIKVEHCTSAREIIYEGSQFPGETVYSITIDNDRTYESAFRPSGSVIEPAHVKAHIGIFYVAENDDEDAVRTREAAWAFMKRHSIPAIFVSNSQVFDQSASRWSRYIDQHAVHLCLESSDRTVAPTRLPIDLTSFLNIDARQMNRNFAYLTGLYSQAAANNECGSDWAVYLKKLTRTACERLVEEYENMDIYAVLRMVMLWIALGGIVYGAQLYTGNLEDSIAPTVAPAAVPSDTKFNLAVPQSTIVIDLTPPTSTAVEIPRVHAAASTSTVSSFSNLLPDIIPESQKSLVCSAQVFGRNEILVKIPMSTKTTWLAKDSITIDVLRDGEVVKTKFSSIDEGLLIEVPKSEAHGVITVLVVTSRRPKVNETFEVDFGKTYVEEALELGKLVFEKVVDTVDEATDRAFLVGDVFAADIRVLSELLMKEVSEKASELGEAWSTTVVRQWNHVRARDFWQWRYAEDFSDKMRLSILKAQIASRLAWLKVQGKTEEHSEYAQKAEVYLARRLAQAFQAKRQRHDANKKAKCGSLARLWSHSPECVPSDD